MLSVSIRDKNGEERTLSFEKEEVTVGRTAGSDIVLPRNNISKRHARLVDKDDKVVIVDLRSTNGTYVNGRRITAPEILTPSDKVYIGDFVLRLNSGAERAEESQRVVQATAPGPPPPPPSEGPTEAIGAGPAIAATAIGPPAPAPPAPPALAPAPLPPPPPLEATQAIDQAELEAAGALGPAPDAHEEVLEEEDLFDLVDVEDDEPVQEMPTDDVDHVLAAAAAEPSPPDDEPATVAIEPVAMPEPPAAAPPAPPAPRLPPMPSAPPPPPAPRPAQRVHPTVAEAPAVGVDIEGARSTVEQALGGPDAIARMVRDCNWLLLESKVEQILGDDRADALPDVLAALIGRGVLDELLEDESVGEIFVNGFNNISVSRGGVLEPVTKGFPSRAVYERVVDSLAVELGQPRGHEAPLFEGNLQSGEAVHITRPPVVPGGPVVVVRRARAAAVTPDALAASGCITEKALAYLRDAIDNRKNVVVAGRPRSGRTTVLNALVQLVPTFERIVIVESSRELSPLTTNVVRLNREGVDAAGVDLSDLVPRLGGGRVVFDEVSAEDIYPYVSLALGGHDGLLATMTSASAYRLLARTALTLELFAGARLDDRARAMVGEAIDVVVVVEAVPGGARVVEVVEVEASATQGYSTRDILSRG